MDQFLAKIIVEVDSQSIDQVQDRELSCCSHKFGSIVSELYGKVSPSAQISLSLQPQSDVNSPLFFLLEVFE
jgi:hypothetical protein